MKQILIATLLLLAVSAFAGVQHPGPIVTMSATQKILISAAPYDATGQFPNPAPNAPNWVCRWRYSTPPFQIGCPGVVITPLPYVQGTFSAWVIQSGLDAGGIELIEPNFTNPDHSVVTNNVMLIVSKAPPSVVPAMGLMVGSPSKVAGITMTAQSPVAQ